MEVTRPRIGIQEDCRPDEYHTTQAELWLHRQLRDGPKRYGELFDRWMGDHDAKFTIPDLFDARERLGVVKLIDPRDPTSDRWALPNEVPQEIPPLGVPAVNHDPVIMACRLHDVREEKKAPGPLAQVVASLDHALIISGQVRRLNVSAQQWHDLHVLAGVIQTYRDLLASS